MKKVNEEIQKILSIGSLISYILACCTPCITTDHETISGLECLLMGWLSILSDVWLFLIWSSNIFYLVTIRRLIAKKQTHLGISVIPVIMAISLFYHDFINYDIKISIVQHNIGYYLWIISYILLLIRNVLKKDNINTLKSISVW